MLILTRNAILPFEQILAQIKESTMHRQLHKLQQYGLKMSPQTIRLATFLYIKNQMVANELCITMAAMTLFNTLYYFLIVKQAGPEMCKEKENIFH